MNHEAASTSVKCMKQLSIYQNYFIDKEEFSTTASCQCDNERASEHGESLVLPDCSRVGVSTRNLTLGPKPTSLPADRRTVYCCPGFSFVTVTLPDSATPHIIHGSAQWRTSVAKYGGRVSQVKSSSCSRRLEKLGLPSVFDTKSFILDDVKLARVIQQQFWMKECDILHLGAKIYSDPSNTFSGVKTPNPKDLRPWFSIQLSKQVFVLKSIT